MRAIRAVLSVLAIWVGIGLPILARAEGDTASAADTLIQRGIQLRRQRDDSGALALFRQAQAADPTPRALAQIALAEQALGKWVEAERDLTGALSKKDDVWIRGNIPLLREALESIQQHLASLSVTSNVPGSVLWIDAVHIGSLPGPATRIAAGTVVIEVGAPGYEKVRRPIVIPAGADWREEINLIPLAPSAKAAADAVVGPTVEPSPNDGNAQRVVGLLVGGLGVAALVTGGTFAVLAANAKSDYAQHCGVNIGAPAGYCDGDGVRLHGDAESRATLATWFLAGGGLAAVAGGTLYLTAPRRASSAQIGIDRAKIVLTVSF